jgi:hypothetical protein
VRPTLATPSDLTTLTDAQLLQLRADVEADIRRRTVLNTAAEQAVALVAEYEAAAAPKPPRPWAGVADAIGPGERVIWTDGNVWRNSSRAWLNKNASPGTYPLGWSQETGLPPTVPEWRPEELFTQTAVTAGTLRRYKNVTYRLLQPINSVNPTWTPDVVPALWKAQT